MFFRFLNNLESRLNSEYFFGANRKFIINLNNVVCIETWFIGGLSEELSKGKKVEIIRRQATWFQD